MLRRSLLQSAGASRRAAMSPLAMSIARSARSRGAKTFSVQQDELSYVWTGDSPKQGVSYDLNWSLCKVGVVGLGPSFRNLRADDLKAKGGSVKSDAPKVVAWDKEIDRELKAQLGSAEATRYVQDAALGAMAANEVTVRMVSDSPAAAMAFRTLMSRTKPADVSDWVSEASVLHVSSLGSRGSIITYNKKANQILMAGSFNAGALVDMLSSSTTDLFLNKGVLPLWGPGDAGGTVYCSTGFDAGSAKVKSGFAISGSGCCRLFMGSPKSDGTVADEYTLMPNSVDYPKAVVMFANDASATIPPASKLTPEQAAFYYAAACAPMGTTAFGKAANVIMAAGGNITFYMVNRGSFANAADADKAASSVVGKNGSASGLLGLEVISVEGETKAASEDAALAAAKGFVGSVGAKCKGIDAVIAAGPKLPEEPKK